MSNGDANLFTALPQQRGYFGITAYHPKYDVNVGSLWRTANAMGAAFFAVVAPRGDAQRGLSVRQRSDPLHTERHLPYLAFDDIDALIAGMPMTDIVAVELAEQSVGLPAFIHPRRAMYLLGAEDEGLPPGVLDKCSAVVQIPGRLCLNVAVAGSIVLYDRIAKATRFAAGRLSPEQFAPENTA